MDEKMVKRANDHCKFARVGRTYDKAIAKLEIGTAAMSAEAMKAWQIVKIMLEKDDCEVDWRCGVPPRGPHEREAAKIMASLGLLNEGEEW